MYSNELEGPIGIGGTESNKGNLGYRDSYLDPYENFNNEVGLENNEINAPLSNNLLGGARQGEYYNSNLDQ